MQGMYSSLVANLPERRRVHYSSSFLIRRNSPIVIHRILS